MSSMGLHGAAVKATSMRTELLLVNQKELEFVIMNMTTKWLNTMNHVGNIVIMCSLSRRYCLLPRTDNIVPIYRVDQLE